MTAARRSVLPGSIHSYATLRAGNSTSRRGLDARLDATSCPARGQENHQRGKEWPDDSHIVLRAIDEFFESKIVFLWHGLGPLHRIYAFEQVCQPSARRFLDESAPQFLENGIARASDVLIRIWEIRVHWMTYSFC